MVAAASARTAMMASPAPIAKAVIARPSITAYGFRSNRAWSVLVAGSAP